MTTPLELTRWIEKAVRGLREEDQRNYRMRFTDQWQQHYEGLLASGKSEEESRSLALALMGNAREARAHLKRTLITQAEQDLMDMLKWPDSGIEPFRMSRKEALTVLPVSFVLALPVWIIVPLNVLLKAAFFLLVTGCILVEIITLIRCMRVCEKWILEKYTIQRLLVWRAVTLPVTIFIVVLGSVAVCEWCIERSCGDIPRLSFVGPYIILWVVDSISTVYCHLSLARKLSRLESNQPPSMPAQTHPAL